MTSAAASQPADGPHSADSSHSAVPHSDGEIPASTGTRLRLGDLHVGDVSPPLTVTVGRTDFVRYAGASGDFNPMHHDDTVATKVGNPSVFGHGMLTAGYMARVVKDWFGPTALRRLHVRFAKPVWPGETLTCVATVTDLDPGTVTVSLSVTNADGEEKLSGTATAHVAA